MIRSRRRGRDPRPLRGGAGARALVARPLEAVAASPVLGAVVLAAADRCGGDVDAAPALGARRRRRYQPPWCSGRPPVRRWEPTTPLAPGSFVLAALAVPALIYLSRPPIEWDCHSIWLHHSSWFHTGGRAAHDAFAEPAYSHPEYPPLLTAPAGIISRLVGVGFDWRIAQAVIAAIRVDAFATAGLALLDTLRRPWIGVAGVAATSGYAVALLYAGVANAEADSPATATVAAAAVLLLYRPDPSRVPLGLALATAAALCKGESFVAVIAVVALGWLAAGRPRSWWWAAPIGAGVAWTLLARFLGAESYLLDGGSLTVGRVARPGVALDRPAVGGDGFGGAGGGPGRRRLRRPPPCDPGSAGAVGLAAVASVVGLVVVFVFGDLPLQAWLDTAGGRDGDDARPAAGGGGDLRRRRVCPVGHGRRRAGLRTGTGRWRRARCPPVARAGRPPAPRA